MGREVPRMVGLLLLLPALLGLGAAPEQRAWDASGAAAALAQAAAHPADAALHARDYGAIDRHALNAPRSAERSLDALAAYLAAPAADDAERARAIFRWIAARIAFDTDAFLSGRFRGTVTDPAQVLRTRRTVCDGFAALFAALAQRAGLEAVVIPGYGKGFGSAPGAALEGPPQHAWNAVRIGGRWHLLDATWGAGSLDETTRRFERAFEPHWFLTPPAQFAYRHWPEDAHWQLLARPLARDEFAALVLLEPAFFRDGLTLSGQVGATLLVQGEASVQLGAPGDVRLTAQLLRDGRAVGGAPVLVQRRGTGVDVRVRPPRPGRYVLRVLSKQGSATPRYESALEVRLLARQGVGGGGGFPQVFRDFAEREARLESPQRGRLPAGSRQRFSLHVPGALGVVAVLGQRRVELPAAGDGFAGELQVPRGALVLYARFAGSERLAGLLQFEGI